MLADGFKFFSGSLSLTLIEQRVNIRNWAQKKTVSGFGEVFCWLVDEKEFIQAEPEKQEKKSLT